MTADNQCFDLPKNVLLSGLEIAESVAQDFIEADAEDLLGEVPSDKDISDTGFGPMQPVQVPACESDGLTLDTSSPDSVPSPTGLYQLRPRQALRVTSDWSVNTWTNPDHTARIDFK